jgi:hypothetical protein
LELLQTTPLALTRSQRLQILVTSLIVAATRLAAVARSLWDWDEAQFSSALRAYDVVWHHPHPPGFPLYIALGNLVRLVVPSDFRALQMIVVASAIALFPLLVWLGREARLPFTVAWGGALVTMFLPNVWVFGGTAFSDVPGLALVVAACAMLLRGCRDPRAYLLGALLLGMAAAMRPQALLIGAAPSLLATWCMLRRRSWKTVLGGMAIGAAVLIVSYAGAALASESVQGYLDSARALREYLRKVDSFLNPERPALNTLLGRFFVFAIPGPMRLVQGLAIAAGAGLLLALVRLRIGAMIIAAMFVPFNVFGWLMLDIHSVSRYTVSFAALYAFLAVDGIYALASLPFAKNRDRVPAFTAGIAALALAAAFAAWTWPAITTQRTTISPPVQAMQFIERGVPRSATLYVHGSMGPYVWYFNPPHRRVEWPETTPSQPFGPHDMLVTEATTAAISGRNFTRARERLFSIARERYFEVSVVPASSVLSFGEGWYGEEAWGEAWWRWMGGRSVTLMPPIAGTARLTLAGEIPTELVPRRPVLEVRVNGQVVDRIVCTDRFFKKSWDVPALSDRPNELVLAIDKVINPAKEGINPDQRDLGLMLSRYGWEPLAR